MYLDKVIHLIKYVILIIILSMLLIFIPSNKLQNKEIAIIVVTIAMSLLVLDIIINFNSIKRMFYRVSPKQTSKTTTNKCMTNKCASSKLYEKFKTINEADDDEDEDELEEGYEETAAKTTDGSTSGSTNGSTSGSNSGSTSGSNSGSTSGSNSGSTSGSNSGSTSGSNSGSTSGSTNGSTSETAKATGTATGTEQSKATQLAPQYTTPTPDIIEEPTTKNEVKEMKFTELPPEMHRPIGTYDKTFTNEFDHGYTYLSTDRWSVPMRQPPICLQQTQQCPPCPTMTVGFSPDLKDFYKNNYPADVTKFDQPYNSKEINVEYIKSKQ